MSKPEGYIYSDGCHIIKQTDETIVVEILLKDQRGYAFSVIKRINKKDIKKGYEVC